MSALLSMAQELSSLTPQNRTYFAEGQKEKKKDDRGLPTSTAA